MPAHYSFLPLAHVPAMVIRLTECLFVIEHDLLKQGGCLYPLVEMSAARIIGAYNKLLSMVGPGNWIVKTIRECCVKTYLDDPRVPRVSSDCAVEILTSWSDTITRHFHEENNKKMTSKKPGFNTALKTMSSTIDQLSKRLEMMEQQFSDVIASLCVLKKTG